MRIKLAALRFMALVALSIASGPAHAQAVSSTVSVACSTTKKLQASINSAAAGTVVTINVSGVCNENIVVPAGKTIILNGASGAKITAANAAMPALSSTGNTTVQKMTIENTSASATAETLVEAPNSTLLIIASDLNSPKTMAVIGAYDNAMVRVVNSRVRGGADSAIDIWGNSTVVLKGDSAAPAGPASFETQVSSPTKAAILCGIQGTLISRVNGTGTVKINNSRAGIWANACTLNLRGMTILPSDNVNGVQSGISGMQSNVSLDRVTISGADWGINLNESRVNIIQSTFSGNLQADVGVGLNSTVSVMDWWGTTVKTSFGSTNTLQCWTGSQIYIDQSAVAQDISTLPNIADCVMVQ